MNGINIYYNSAGTPVFAQIDMRKYGKELSSFFKKMNFSVESKSTIKTEKKARKKPLTGMTATLQAVEDVENGNVVKCKNFEEYLQKTAKYA
jgi:hypothetical protein